MRRRRHSQRRLRRYVISLSHVCVCVRVRSVCDVNYVLITEVWFVYFVISLSLSEVWSKIWNLGLRVTRPTRPTNPIQSVSKDVRFGFGCRFSQPVQNWPNPNSTKTRLNRPMLTPKILSWRQIQYWGTKCSKLSSWGPTMTLRQYFGGQKWFLFHLGVIYTC